MLLQLNTLPILEDVQNRPKPRSKPRVGKNIPESSSSNPSTSDESDSYERYIIPQKKQVQCHSQRRQSMPSPNETGIPSSRFGGSIGSPSNPSEMTIGFRDSQEESTFLYGSSAQDVLDREMALQQPTTALCNLYIIPSNPDLQELENRLIVLANGLVHCL